MTASIGQAYAQAANQCTAANALPLINSPANTGWVQDNSPGITHTPTLNANQATTRYGTQINGAIVLAGELQWNNPAGPNHGRATMEIFVNGVRYATLFTSEAVAGLFSTDGEFWPDNGALISVNGNAETATQQPFIGDATSTGRTFRPITVRLPLSVAQVTSVQYLYRSDFSDSQADDDIRYRNLQINQCKATLRLQKAISGGRLAGTNQFTLNIAQGGTTLATTTTTGTGNTVGNGIATVAPFVPAAVHTLSEVAAGTTNLAAYGTTYTCTNASSGTGTVLPSGSTTSFAITPASGDDITCLITNTLLPPSVSISKASNGPWTVGQAGATYTLTASNTSARPTSGTITVRDQLPAGIGIRPATGFTAATGWTCTYSDEIAQGTGAVNPFTGMAITCTSPTAMPAGGSAALTIPVLVTSAAPTSVINHVSVGGGGDPFNGGTAPVAGPTCTDVAHCSSTTTSITPSPPLPTTCAAGTAANLFQAPLLAAFFTDNATQTQTATLIATAENYTVGTGTGGRFAVDMNWRWNAGMPAPSNSSTLTLRVNGINYATLTTQNGFPGYGALTALNGASLFGSTTTMEINRRSLENVWVTLPSSVTTITSVQMVYTGGATPADDFNNVSSTGIYGCLSSADLSITKASTTSPVTPGGNITYSIVATNNGPSAANNAIVIDDWTTQPGLDCSTATGGTAACSASGAGTTQCPTPASSVTPEALLSGIAIPVFPNGGIVTFTLQCRVTATGQ